MFDKESGLRKYLKLVMRSEFPVTNLLTPDEFIKFLKSRSFCLYKDDLEWCDKEGLIRSVLRLKRPKLNLREFPFTRYRYMETNMYAIQHYYNIDLVEFPVDGDFRPWSEYIKEKEDICLYYHPYQILQIDSIVLDLHATKIVGLHDIMNPSKSDYDISTRIRQLNRVREEQIETWIPRVGLLILLEDYYGRWFSRNIPLNIYDISTRSQRITKLREWAKKFSPSRSLLLSNMGLEQIEEFYRSLCIRASQFDPLADWFILQRIIKKTRRYGLKDKALLAQEYYGYLFMLADFILDLCGKKMPEPDDILSHDNGKWKNRIFGDPFDYASKKTQNQILKYFLIDRPIELVIIVEGETEERIIELILKARGVDLEKDGFFVYNIKGLNNLEHLKPLFRVSQLIDITIFAMVDNDENVDKKIVKMKDDAKNLGYTKSIQVRKWNRDFENENFGIDMVLDKVNQTLYEKGYRMVEKKDVEGRMKTNGEALIKAIENIARKNNLDRFKNNNKDSSIISKPRLGELLIEDRLKEIQIEDEPEWFAKLPIEVELKEIFKLIPSYL